MAVRITHTNNSQGHDGTYVYRSTSPMDPQALPAPIADEPPVALGATFEYIDTAELSGDQYYRTQDHEGGQVSTVSAEVMISIPEDYASAQVGDEIGGGIYAGTLVYDDAREFHIVFGKSDSAVGNLQWGASFTTTGATDSYDGVANSDDVLNNHDDGSSYQAFYACRDYQSGGKDDWYLPANEEAKLFAGIKNISEYSSIPINYIWTSNEVSNNNANQFYFGSNAIDQAGKTYKTATRGIIPVRRVPV